MHKKDPSGSFLCTICYTILHMSHIADTIEDEIQLHLSTLFHFSMWWRIFYGSIRIVLGFVLLKMVGTPFTEIFYSLMSHEITEDPKDAIFQMLYSIIEDHSFTVTYFIAAYLLFWGVIDVALSILLLRHKLWAFHTSMVLITLFILYEMYRVTHTHSFILILVIIVDLVILYLINDEYHALRTQQISKQNPT